MPARDCLYKQCRCQWTVQHETKLDNEADVEAYAKPIRMLGIFSFFSTVVDHTKCTSKYREIAINQYIDIIVCIAYVMVETR